MKQGYAYDTRGLQEPKPLGHMPMEHASKLSVQEFQDKYEKPNMPVVIAGCADKWPGYNGAWQPKELMKHYRHRRFRCGEDDDGYPVKMKLKVSSNTPPADLPAPPPQLTYAFSTHRCRHRSAVLPTVHRRTA